MERSIENEKEIRTLVENWASAVRNKEMEKILAHHANDMVMFDVPEPFQSIGIDAYRKTWALFFKYAKTGVFDIQTLNIVADEHVAFCMATMICEDCSGGEGYEQLDFRLTIGLRKINSQWVIVHEHHSIPSK